MQDTKNLQKKLFDEIEGRIKLEDSKMSSQIVGDNYCQSKENEEAKDQERAAQAEEREKQQQQEWIQNCTKSCARKGEEAAAARMDNNSTTSCTKLQWRSGIIIIFICTATNNGSGE